MSIAIMKSKLIPPKPRSTYYLPERLEQLFGHVPQFPITTLQAGPGYGKSTSLLLASAAWRGEIVWYTLTTYDRDPIVFLTHLIHGMNLDLPSVGLGGHEEIQKQLELSLYEIIRMIQEKEGSYYLILDDYHTIDDVEELNHLFQLLIEHQPPNLHIIFSSRKRPRLAIINGLRMKGELLEIKQGELLFTNDEIHQLYERYGLHLEKDRADQLMKLTEGWVIVLALIGQQLSTGADLEQLLSQFHQREEILEYLIPEVLSTRSADEQRFLLATSICEEVTPELGDLLLGWQQSSTICNQFLQEELFLTVIQSGRFRYHALFRQVLRERLKEDARWYESLLRKLAQHYEGEKKIEEALRVYLELEDWLQVRSLLELQGDQWLEQGQLDTLQIWLDCISDQQGTSSLAFPVFQGDIARLRNRFQEALLSYKKAEDLARQEQDPYWQSRALEGQARLYLDTIQPAQADRLLREATRILGGRTKTEHKAKLLELLAENQINLGQHRTAEKLFRIAREIRHEVSRGELEARLLLRTGRLRAAIQAVESLQQEGESRVSRFHRDPSVLLSLLYAFLGEREAAKRMAEKGIFTGNSLLSPFVEAVGWIRLGHASQLFEHYEPTMILQCYQTAIQIFERLQVERGKVEALMGIALLYASLGQVERARHYAQEGRKIAERAKDMWMLTLCDLAQAYSYVMDENWQQAGLELENTYQQFTLCGDNYGSAVSMLWLAYVSWRQQDWNRLHSYLPRLFLHIQHDNYQFLFRQRTLLGPKDVQVLLPMLVEAQKQGIALDYVNPLLADLGFDKVDLHPGYTLRIQTFGEFRVWLGEREVSEKEWQREKAKQLFQLLLTYRKQLLPRELIYQLLWPEVDEKAANRDFKVALNALMKALEPNRTARSTPFYIQRHGTSYGFNLASGYELDVEQFEYAVQHGLREKEDRERRKEWLSKAIQLYQGDYLLEQRYEDWSIEERERFQVLFLRAAEQHAYFLVQDGEYEACIQLSSRILQLDPCWEEAYRLQMLCYYQLQHRAQALKVYEKCKHVLEEELGVEPLPETVELWSLIRETKPLPFHLFTKL